MEIHLLTVFPQFYRPYLEHGILARASEKGLLDFYPWSLRRFADDRHAQVDDRVYGGGPGMVMKPEPYFRGVEHLKQYCPEAPVILTDAGGRKFDQDVAKRLSNEEEMIILTGRYEGVDQRVKEHLVDERLSLGDFVTPGGDAAAMTMTSAVVRLIPGVLGNEQSVAEDSYQEDLLAPPVYTRPSSYRGMQVPEVLLSGDHGKIEAWRKRKALERTRRERPELLD